MNLFKNMRKNCSDSEIYLHKYSNNYANTT